MTAAVTADIQTQDPGGAHRSGESPGNQGTPLSRIGIAAAVLIAADIGVLTLSGHLAFQIIATAALFWIPGRLVLRCCRYEPAGLVAAAVITLGLSVTSLMLMGLAANTAGRLLGLAQPLGRTSVLVTVNVCLAALVLAGARRPSPAILGWPTWRQLGVAAAVLLPPVLAMCGAARLNNAQPNTVAVIGAVAAGALLVVAVLRASRWGDAAVAALLASAAAALTLSFSMRGSYLFGFDIQQEFGTFLRTQAAASWSPGHTGAADDAYRAMLSITVLPQLLVQVTGGSGLVVFRIVLPLLVAAVPVAVFALLRYRTSRRISVAVAAVMILMPQLASQLPAVTRQAVALLIFGALLVVLFDVALRPGRTVVALLLSTGLVVSHYSSAYVAVFVLAGTWLATTLLRLGGGDGRRYYRAVPAVVAGWLVFSCLGWNVLITNSATNLRQFVSTTASSGVQVLPANTKDAGWVTRWLKAPVPAPITGPELSDLAAAQYRRQFPWMNHYPDADVAAAPLGSASVPVARGAWNLKPLLDLATTVAFQALLLSIVAGTALLIWWHRRRRDPEIELPLAAFVALVLTGFGRLSGSAMESYNADRLYLQTFMLFGVALVAGATVVGRARPSVRRAGQVVAAALAMVLFLSTTQVAAAIIGGNPGPNVANTGEAVERYLYTRTDVETAQWLGRQTPRDALIFVDRYTVLAMWNTTNLAGQVYTSLAPSTVDPRGYVMFNNVNVNQGRARALVGRSMGIFRTPADFMNEHKNLIYSTADSRIYR